MTAPSAATREADLAAYAYSYPHKSSYRTLSPPVPITEAWQTEDRSRLSLYIHVPFCEMRCSFCNLFTQSQPTADLVERYLATLVRQMNVTRTAVPDASFSQLAIGGGTPTFLDSLQLDRLLRSVADIFGQPIARLPTSVETSPVTATADRLAVLADHGVTRISLGVQSFLESETRLFGRPQHPNDVHSALERIRAAGFPVLNLDLIYGHPHQTRESWQSSLQSALRYHPEELYLYPLYIRPETGLARQDHLEWRHRTDLYEIAVDRLGEQGYLQSSLRCFHLPRKNFPETYACQRDGMIGLGCGARSYTRRLHYATKFAVSQPGIRAILNDWIALPDPQLALATHGIRLCEEEQRRRYLILSLLQAEGLSLTDFTSQFPGAEVHHLSGIAELIERGWLNRTTDRYVLTPTGLLHSDTVGPLLYSPLVRERLRAFVERPQPALASPE